MDYKPAKGTKDYPPNEENLRQKVIRECEKVFNLCDAQPIDTPVFEIREILMEKYGEEANKEIYELKTEKEDGEHLALRFDLTVPWSRYVKSNGIQKMRRYQIGKVYRRDQPNMSTRRLREFYQCDFDILGNGFVKEAVDAECISVLNRILTRLELKDYIIKINNRVILKSLFEYCGIADSLFMCACSSIDKLDKKGMNYVKEELLSKGVTEESVELLQKTFKMTKTMTLEKLLEIEWLSDKFKASFQKFWEYLCIFGADSKVKIDFCLARGLDYYTGLIFEVQLRKGKLGSIAAGGRYDQLCNGIECVGFSMGIDRLTSLLNPIPKREQNVDVKVISVESNEEVFRYKLNVIETLRTSGIKCGSEMSLEANLKTQITKTLKSDIPYIIFIGNSEVESNTVTLKILDAKIEVKKTPLSNAIDCILKNSHK